MIDFHTVAGTLHDKTFLAAIGFIGLMLWRSFTVGQKVGAVIQVQKDHGKQLDYLVARLDKHIENGNAGTDHN